MDHEIENNLNSQTNIPILEAQKLTKSFGGLKAVSNVDIVISKGEIMALIGPNGAGKTTLVNLLTGFLQPDAGTIMFNNRNIRNLSVHARCILGMTRTFQIAQPFKGLSVIENVMVAAMSVEPSIKKCRESALKWLQFAGLEHKKDTTADQLTLVEQKELELLRCLATKPKLLFVDELMTGLTPAESQEAISTLKTIRDTGVSILFIEHKMDVVVRLAEKVIVLDFGKKIAEGVCEVVMNNEDVIQAYLGESHVELARIDRC
jgi:branched-chain amino acid transport system ATP-binding protein